jgi:dimeric dUTPase (all-alpha-NTP-PPase superfamily)
MSVILCLIVCAVLRAPFAAALVVEEYPECLDFFRTLAVSIHDWAVVIAFDLSSPLYRVVPKFVIPF